MVTFGRGRSIFSTNDARPVLPARSVQDAVTEMAFPFADAVLVVVHWLVIVPLSVQFQVTVTGVVYQPRVPAFPAVTAWWAAGGVVSSGLRHPLVWALELVPSGQVVSD